MNYYDLFEIAPNASDEVIKASYKAMSKKYHPDNCPNGEQMMKKLNEAYDVLSDSVKRKEYDKTLEISNDKPKDVDNKEKIPFSQSSLKEKIALIIGSIFYLLITGIIYILEFAWAIILVLIIIGFFTGHSQVLFGKLFDWVLSLFT